MSQKYPNDEYSASPSGLDQEDGGFEEQTHSFDEEYVSGSRPAPKKGRPSRKERRAARRAAQEDVRVVREAPTVGRDLKSGQMLVYDSELDEVDYTDPDDVPEWRDYLPIRFRRYGRLGIAGGVMYALFVISISVILACFAWMCAVDVLALNKDEVTATVTIDPYEPTGDMPTTVRTKVDGEEQDVEIKVDIDQVATALKDGGIIEYKWLFKLFSAFSHANIKMDPGRYSLDTTLDYRALVSRMQEGSGSQEIVPVTFPEGMTVDQVFDLLESNVRIKKDKLYESVTTYDYNYDFLKDLPLGDTERLEGYLFPDTYQFYVGESPELAVSRFLDNAKRRFADNGVEEKAAARGMTLHEVLTMASLIEKEAGSDEERPIMASVIYNRLNAGMQLGLDSTINYIKGTSTFDLTQEDLAIDDPYNTYIYKGLPPGPICNPGLASIMAVLEPASTNYYYWYSVDGVSSFFNSYEEQQAFAQAHPY